MKILSLKKIYLKALINFCCIFLINILHAQQFTMSSMGMLNSTTNLASSINFIGIANCIDVQSGIANYTSKVTNMEFSINCNIDQKFNTLGLKLFPNPVSSIAKIKFSSTPPLTTNFKITICNTEGMVILILNTTGYQIFQGYQLNLADLTSGTYFIKIESPQCIEALKFIKVN